MSELFVLWTIIITDVSACVLSLCVLGHFSDDKLVEHKVHKHHVHKQPAVTNIKLRTSLQTLCLEMNKSKHQVSE